MILNKEPTQLVFFKIFVFDFKLKSMIPSMNSTFLDLTSKYENDDFLK